MRQKADQIIKESLEAVMPDHAVEKALQNFQASWNGMTLTGAFSHRKILQKKSRQESAEK